MKTLKSFFIAISCIGLISCSYTCRKQKVEENCFQAFESEAKNYNKNSKEKVLYIWPITGENNGDRFLLKLSYVGYLAAFDSTHSSGLVKGDGLLYFTGRVIKVQPSWAEHHIGGSDNHVLPEVKYKNKNYLMFPRMLGDNWIETLPMRCKP